MSHVIHLEDKDFDAKVLQSDKPTLVDFSADWCGPCKALSPIIEELAKDLEGRVQVAKIDVDNSAETAQKFNVRSVPALILFKNSAVVAQTVGVMNKNQLLEFIDNNI